MLSRNTTWTTKSIFLPAFGIQKKSEELLDVNRKRMLKHFETQIKSADIRAPASFLSLC